MNYAVCDAEGKIKYRLVGKFSPEDFAPYEAMGLRWFGFEGDISYATHIVNGEPVAFTPPPPTVEEIAEAITDAVQQHLDAKARERNYDGILSLASYVTSTDPVFRAEGEAGAAWRDACWRTCYQGFAEVQAGQRTMPTVEEAIASLPVFVWPTV